VQVAGKTGTAQAKYKGREDTISWFICWAPFDNPKYTVAVMAQGGEHGGTVACPIAARIMERSLAMDEGKFEAQVAWLPPAHKTNPFQMIKEVSFRDSGIDSGGDDENANGSQVSDVQMAGAGGDPDVEPEADSRGKVARRAVAASARAVPVAAPQPQRNFFQRLFGVKRQPAQPPPPPSRQQRTTTR
jgi:hypothetical protein